jgi:RHS repeat-associated protein
MRTLLRVALVVAIALIGGVAHAADAQQYIVVLSLHGELTDAAVSAAGGVVTERFWDHVVARLTPSAIEALQSDRAVKYIQRIGETVDSPAAPRAEAHTLTVVPGGKADWAPPAWSSGAYQYDGSGNITAIGTSATPSSDGRTNSYGYDVDSRLTSWSATGQTTQTYTYDVYGNLTSGVTVDAVTNRLTGTGISYDVAGNQVNNGTYGYDSLNMMTSKVGSANEGTSWYVYTPDDERIGTLQPAIDKWNWTLRGFDHDVLREYQSSNSTPASAWVWIEDHVYRRSGLLLSAERPPAEGGQRHFHLDHLGTPRLVTGLNGGLVALHDYAPYGGEITSPCQEKNLGFDREEPHRFTVHERDFAASCADTTALDYMHARAYSATVGRFLSVDIHPGNSRQPRSWNRYFYGSSNPLQYLDPNGLEAIVFIIDPGSNASEWMGHGALWITSGRERRLVSFGGDQLRHDDPRSLVEHYRANGRNVTAYHLKTTPEQDAAMLAYIKSHPSYGTDSSKPLASLMLTENCTTAVCNVLKAGGVIKAGDDPAKVLGYLDAPAQLQTELENGSLRDMVSYTNRYPAYHKGAMEDVMDFFADVDRWMFENSFGTSVVVTRH